jgi:hypothetical protein
MGALLETKLETRIEETADTIKPMSRSAEFSLYDCRFIHIGLPGNCDMIDTLTQQRLFKEDNHALSKTRTNTQP